MESVAIIRSAQRGELRIRRDDLKGLDPSYVPAPPPRPAKATSFRIRQLGAISGGAIVSGDLLFFQIWADSSGATAFYIYVGAGLGVAAKYMPPAAGTLPGDWNRFSTSSPLSVGAFSSVARFTTASCGQWSINYLNIRAVGERGESVYLNIGTGTTYGAGASSTVGRFVWYPEEVMQYDGKD